MSLLRGFTPDKGLGRNGLSLTVKLNRVFRNAECSVGVPISPTHTKPSFSKASAPGFARRAASMTLCFVAVSRATSADTAMA